MNVLNIEKPLVSIVMPAYNCGKFIEQSIFSVLNQSYTKWELIIIDDCSKDNTVSLIECMAKNDDRILIYKNAKNSGVSATRNRGISVAKGEWIAFLDSDDIWNELKLEKQLAYAADYNAEFLFTGSAFINEEGTPYSGIFQIPEKVNYKLLRKHNVVSCSSVIIKKSLTENMKMERDDLHEDYAFWLKILKTGVNAYGLNDPLITYRISRNSKSGNKFKTLSMTYKVFRFVGMNPVSSVFFTLTHVIGSLKKYKKIKIKKSE
ncbi:glycosyltransferase family 2 protein [Paenibacillus sp. FSL R7-0331]|uniref:glycosyltransferase family 2 protein n=1 Tax=Paenibacillus sp. FSL R7-0331 TaxID=1536773 RepID=UPI0004F746B7|nr:glycosyltransferase family 2 protein [Paenibacillus sp. FSL R7-0331]AIQ54438.1 glycosyl transferase family 2 [Paenibacillus sp. FSL R7-0331]